MPTPYRLPAQPANMTIPTTCQPRHSVPIHPLSPPNSAPSSLHLTPIDRSPDPAPPSTPPLPRSPATSRPRSPALPLPRSPNMASVASLPHWLTLRLHDTEITYPILQVSCHVLLFLLLVLFLLLCSLKCICFCLFRHYVFFLSKLC